MFKNTCSSEINSTYINLFFLLLYISFNEEMGLKHKKELIVLEFQRKKNKVNNHIIKKEKKAYGVLNSTIIDDGSGGWYYHKIYILLNFSFHEL